MNYKARDFHEPSGVETITNLLRGELAAVAAYDKAMARLEDQTVLADLQTIRDEHARAVEILRAQAADIGAEAPDSSGPWTTVAAAVTGADGMISPSTALWALCQGEEHAADEYQTALKHNGLTTEGKQAIRVEILPRCQKHLDELNRLMGGMK
jgi:uncharacterized protein DUF2383